jgi:hypothetical protein
MIDNSIIYNYNYNFKYIKQNQVAKHVTSNIISESREELNLKNNNSRNICKKLELLINSLKYWFNYMNNLKNPEMQFNT